MAYSGGSNDALETINVRLPDEIVRILDDMVAKGLFSNRSEAIREFARQYVIEAGGSHG